MSRNDVSFRYGFQDLGTIDPQWRERLAHARGLFADYTAAYLTNGVAKGFLRADLDVTITPG